MKNKLILSFIIFIIVLLSIVFANSYVQALANQEKLEILEQDIKNNKYNNIEEKGINRNCNNYCIQNENCQIYQKDSECTRRNNHCSQENHHYKRNCYNGNMCNI